MHRWLNTIDPELASLAAVGEVPLWYARAIVAFANGAKRVTVPEDSD